MFTATITLSNTFTTAEPQTRCDIPSCDDQYMPQYDDAFVGPHYFANFTIPFDSTKKKFSSCNYYKPLTNETKDLLSTGRSDQYHINPNNGRTRLSTNSSLYQCDPSHFNQSVELQCTNYIYDQTIYT